MAIQAQLRRLSRFEADNPIRKLQLLGLLGVLGHPAYFAVWTWLYPQPFDSLPLRLACAALCVPLAVGPYLPRRLHRAVEAYAVLLAFLVLACFFNLMTLLNGASMAWQMSLVASMVCTALLLDPARFVAFHLLGAMAAVAFHALVLGREVPRAYLDAWPVHAFTLLGGILFNFSGERSKLGRMLRGAAAVGGSVAHEMRTPLLGIRLDAQGIRGVWAGIEADLAAGRAPDPADAESVARALARIERQAERAGTTLDLMLANIAGRTAPAAVAEHSMAETVQAAAQRYPFREGEAAMLELDTSRDFRYRGSELMMAQLLFNLWKNAYRAMASTGGSSLKVRLEPGPRWNRLVVSDTGPGIPPGQMASLFQPFARGGRPGEGVGLGLAFCRAVAEEMGGAISASGNTGGGASFTVELPAPRDKGAAGASGRGQGQTR